MANGTTETHARVNKYSVNKFYFEMKIFRWIIIYVVIYLLSISVGVSKDKYSYSRKKTKLDFRHKLKLLSTKWLRQSVVTGWLSHLAPKKLIPVSYVSFRYLIKIFSLPRVKSLKILVDWMVALSYFQ